MDAAAIALFHELADRSPSEREKHYAQHQVPASVRDEVESLLQFDNNTSDPLASSVASAAENVLQAGAHQHDPAGSSADLTRQPEVIGRYGVIRLLGRGGMGEVYLAHDPVLDRDVAVKLIGAALDDGSARKRLAQEARAAARLRHPNIVTIFDAGEHDGRSYIAMEYVPGETLGSLIRRRARLSLGRRLDLIEGVCAGLAHAHRAGVVHLDIKPDNLMLDETGVARVLDFGIARVLKGEALSTFHHAGTLRYMSPEQLDGRPVDRRSDVFSLGCSFFELVAYVPAYAGSTAEIVTRITAGRVPCLVDAMPGIDPRFDAIVQRAMAVDPADRYDNLEDLRAELARIREEIGPVEEELLLAPAIASQVVTTVGPAMQASSPGSSRAQKSPSPWSVRRTVAIAAVAALAAGAGATMFRPTPASTPVQTTPLILAQGPLETASPVSDPTEPKATTASEEVRLPRGAGERAPGLLRSTAAGGRSSEDARATADAGAEPPAPTPAEAAVSDRVVPPAPPPVVEPSRPESAISPGVDTAISAPNPTPDPPKMRSATDAVLEALNRYQGAYEALDVSGVLQVFPSLGGDQVEQLRRTFAGMTAYEIELRNTRVNAQTDVAIVHAEVARRMVPRVGRPVANKVDTEFHLRRDGGEWVITAVKLTSNP